MSKYLYNLNLPKIVLEPLNGYLAQQGFLIQVGSNNLKLDVFEGEKDPVATIRTLPYTFKFKTDSCKVFRLVKDFVDTFQMQNLMAGNEEKELRDMMRRDFSFRSAVKQLEKLWKEKEQNLDPKSFTDAMLNG